MTEVWVHTNSAFGGEEFDARFDAVTGMNSVFQSGPITLAEMSLYDVVVFSVPDTPFTTDELEAMKQYVAAGGRIVFFGEAEFYSASNAIINAALAYIGADISIDGTPTSNILTATSDPINGANAGSVVETNGYVGRLNLSGDAHEILQSSDGFAVGAYDQIGPGEVFVFGDTNMRGFENSFFFDYLANIDFVGANAAPTVEAGVTSAADEDDAAYSVDLLAGASDGDGDTLTATGVTLVSGDDTGVTVDGNELDVDPNAYTHLADGDSEVVTYSYTIDDGNGGSVAQTATVTITGVNDAPTVSAAVEATATEDDAAYSVDLLANADDVDDGAVLNATGVTYVSGDASGITVDGNELDVDPTAYNHLAAGESEVVTYSYNVTDEHGATVAQTATVTINGVNDAPTAVDDTLGGSGGGVLRVGYYDMLLGQGNANQVEAIEAAGHVAVLITDLSAAELADIDMLVVQNPDNYGYGAEYLANLATIEAAVDAGMTLIIHDRHVHAAETILPGSGGFTITGGAYGNDVQFIDDAHSVASGPGGNLDDTSLDNGNVSTHGFAIGGTLPTGADLILSTGDASQIVTFSYSHGAGSVIYSTIPLDFYLSGDTVGSGPNSLFGMAEEYATNLIDYAATDLREQSLTDEDTIAVIDGADLLANDSDPDATDVLVISGVSATSTLGASVTLNPDGTISYDPTAGLNYLAAGEVVEDSFTYTISDGNGGSDTATVTFTVVGINDAPSAPVDGDGPTGAAISEHLDVGEEIGIDADSTDPEGDAVEYFFRDGDGNRVQTLGFFAIDALTGVVTLAAEVNYELDTQHMIIVYASDGSDESSTTFTVDVLNVVEHLFTAGNDGTAENPIDFNNLAPGSYDYDGAQYNALGGDDYVILPDVAITLEPGHAWDYGITFSGGAGNDVIQGGDGDDSITGSEGDDSLFGSDGDDRLVGSSGDDILSGGDGSDKLTGSEGRDIFIFTDSELGTTKDGEHDTITDFKQRTDKIDISALYDGGTFRGFTNGRIDEVSEAYKVGYYYEAGKTWIEGDTDGDGMADFTIELMGKFKLGKGDFVVETKFITAEAQWDSAVGDLNYDYARYHQDEYWIA